MSSSVRNRLYLVAPFFVVGFAVLITPSDDGPTICPFALCTGSACPGCGLTRAATSLVRGDLGAAASYHPLVFFFAIQGLAAWTWFLMRQRGVVGPLRQRTLNTWLIATGVLLVGVWIARILTGTLPPV